MGTSSYDRRTEGNRFAKPRPDRFSNPLDKAKGYEVIWQNVAEIFSLARTLIGPHYVYFTGEQDGPLKIGSSKDPVSRLRTMQTGNPQRLRIEYVLLGGPWLEKLFHELWHPYAIASARNAGKINAPAGTEWFKPEIRPVLEPILETAIQGQIEWVQSATADLQFEDGIRVIREAHAAHGHVGHKYEVPLFLAQGAGTIFGRVSRA